jgi:hypothetical protein
MFSFTCHCETYAPSIVRDSVLGNPTPQLPDLIDGFLLAHVLLNGQAFEGLDHGLRLVPGRTSVDLGASLNVCKF